MDIYNIGDKMEEIVYPEFLILENKEIEHLIKKHLEEEKNQ